MKVLNLRPSVGCKSVSFKTNNQLFHKVDDFLYKGYRPNEGDIKHLKSRGISIIIDFSFENLRNTSPIKEKILAQNYGLKYYNIPLLDSNNPTESEINSFFNIVENAKSKNEKIFVHCLHGKNRTGLMCEIYKLKNKISTYSESISTLIKSRYPFSENPMALTLLKNISAK